MTDETEETFPCARGCTWDAIGDEPPRPKTARRGELLCNSDFYRLTAALNLVPDLMANMRAQISSISGNDYSERVSGGGDGSPAPLRIGPLDASDSLYAKLVSWTEVIGGSLHTAQPSVAVWMNFREVQGSRPVTVETAHDTAEQLSNWFLNRLGDICTLPIAATLHDDIVYGWEDARGVFSLSAAYGVNPRPVREAEKRECPVCGEKEVFVAWPDSFNPELSVLCGRCSWVADPGKFRQYVDPITG